MNFDLAAETCLTLIKVNAVLDAQLRRIQARAEEIDFVTQRQLFGCAMASLLDILNPIYLEYPKLEPKQMGGDYDVPGAALDAAVKLVIG